MPIARSNNTKPVQVNVCGSSVFGRYPKISVEKTYNMFISDNFLVPYAGYKVIIPSELLNGGKSGRGIFTSTKFDALIVVIDSSVYLIRLSYNQQTENLNFRTIQKIGDLQTSTGVVYIVENNLPQILISDNNLLYIYDPTISRNIQIVPLLNFTPGYITFHDTYFICAARNDTTGGGVSNNSFRLSLQNQGYLNNTTDPGATAWPSGANNVGFIQTKPDNTQAVVRFPSRGNMIMVMGSIVTESWFDYGSQLFPYQRNNQFNVDYGCISPATVAYMDELVVWLAQNEKSGPIIMASDGGTPKKITTDGIDYLFSTLQNPEDSQAFMYRQDGHLFYHINFYSDNLSLFYDFSSDKFFHASDQNLDYFIASEIAFIGNQYYFVSRNTGNIYAFDTQYTTYNDVESNESNTTIDFQIPRIRICKNIRLPSQDYFIANDIGFTIETGQTNYVDKNMGTTTPQVFFSASYDGGSVFGNEWAYNLPAIGSRRNRLMWWQLGLSNDFVPKFRFEGIGRFVVTDGILNIRL